MDASGNHPDSLQRLLKLKRHEVPPPGYFERLPRDIVAGVRAAQGRPGENPLTRGPAGRPWLVRLWESLVSRPAFAGFVGASACAAVIGLIALAEKPAPAGAAIPLADAAGVPAGWLAAEGMEPLRLNGSNEVAPPPRNLFEMAPAGQSLPAGFSPPGN